MLRHSKNVPTRIGDATDWKVASAGDYHSLGIRSDDSLWAWGYNREGQLGNGTAGNYHYKSTPVRVGAAND
ncbi:MAG: RCC1 domain-containing protein [Coriobacteriia bacterium]|nr:RCC1 domain-containing protein [Coriobacteriia bacterium]